MRKFTLGHVEDTDVAFDLDLVMKGRCLIQASSGAGKSETVKKICYATKDVVQSIIIDPEAEYAPLRAEMPFLLVGQGGEIPATLETAELVAHRLLETGASAILSLLELGHARREWTRRFLVALDTAPKELRRETLLFIDEAHIFAMEQGNALDPVGMSVADIASRGRKRGIGLVVVTQRLALLSNHVIGLCENILIGRTGLLDAPRTAKLFAKTGADGRDFIKQLGRIGDGQFYAYGRAFSLLEPTLFQVERVPGQTLAKASKHGKRLAPPTPEEIKKLLPRFADLPKEAAEQKQTLETLRADLATANKALREMRSSAPAKPEVSRIDQEKIRAMEAKLKNLSDLVADAQKHAAAEERRRRTALKELEDIGKSLGHLRELLQPIPGGDAGIAALAEEAVQTREQMRGFGAAAALPKPYIPALAPARPVAEPRKVAEGESPVSLPEQKLLNALGWFAELGIAAPTSTAVALIAGYNVNGGSFSEPRAALVRREWITSPARGVLTLTEEGRKYVQPSGIETTNAGIQRAVLDRFGVPEGKLLRPLIEAYPEAMTTANLAEAAGYNPNGGSFSEPRAALTRVGVIESPGRGMLRAANILFPEGR